MTKEEFSELFPKKEIKYKDNVVITVRPIPMAVMPEIIDTLKNIISLVKDDTPAQQLAFSAFDDLVKLIPHSVKTDLKEIPGTFLPEFFNSEIFFSKSFLISSDTFLPSIRFISSTYLILKLLSNSIFIIEFFKMALNLIIVVNFFFKGIPLLPPNFTIFP